MKRHDFFTEKIHEITCKTDSTMHKRARPTLIMTDNETNFKYADQVIDEKLRKGQKIAKSEIEQRGIERKFVPPYASNFKSLAEAAVKSVKRQLHQVQSRNKRTYEDLTTMLAKIEAILNSRLLCRYKEGSRYSSLH